MMTKPMTILLSMLLAAALPARADDADALNLAVAERHIIPAYRQLAESTARLDAAASTHCAQGAAGLEPIRAAFAEAFLDWEGIQHIRFGPVQVLSRDFRFQLWPDKRGTVGRHLSALLADHDPAQLEPDTFAAGSAAVQGFGALERLLYDPPAGADPNWTCAVMQAMTANLARMSRETLAEWDGGAVPHRTMFATASDGNDYYDSAQELSARLLNNLHAQLERVVDQKLGRPLGETADKTFPRRAEAWRSGLSLAAIRRNLEALLALYRTGFQPRIDDAALDGRITAGITDALERLGTLESPLAEAVAIPADRATLDAVRTELAALKLLVAGELTGALGLPLGFNSLDGD